MRPYVLALLVIFFSISAGTAGLFAPDVCDCRMEAYWDGDEWTDFDCQTELCDGWCGELFDPDRGHWYCECILLVDHCNCRTAATYASNGNPEYVCDQVIPCITNPQTCKPLANPPNKGFYAYCNCRN